ncbi:Cullin domain-containing protein [Heracleum sosnowskyi]|uniref:Cullin domain-containing protein n=1 Tax=Heracleum sosnowskyi TaxID=360622 RepID=A0AAD8JFR3_9APIA|nr:Cullin domain-containing protein [Heracleum sosnowskyi]
MVCVKVSFSQNKQIIALLILPRKMRQIIKWEEGLKVVEECIEKARMILDGYQPTQLFTSEDYIKYYDCIYYMSVQRDPCSYSPQLCERFKRALQESIAMRVLPSLWDKSDSSLLLELTNMWARYKKMANCLGGIFQYLERGQTGDSLAQVSARCFHDLVCFEHYQEFQAAAISLNHKDRDEETPLNRDLLQNVSSFFVDMGVGLGKKFYYNHFEKAVLADAASYYSQLASWWRVSYSFTVYVQKTALCLAKEKARASQFLYQDSVEKLLQVAQSHMLNQVSNQLLEMKKAESSNGGSVEELLSLCANLNLEDGSSSMC